MTVKSVTDTTFEEEVINSERPVLVLFWAPWCKPCEFISPLLEEVSKENEQLVKVVKVNTDECMETTQKYNVRGIPCTMVLKKGVVLEQVVGAVIKGTLQNMVKKANAED